MFFVCHHSHREPALFAAVRVRRCCNGRSLPHFMEDSLATDKSLCHMHILVELLPSSPIAAT